MAEIIPFRALRYDPQFIPDLAEVVTPPYDVISPDAQERYYARHPYNVIRLILARDTPPGSARGTRYEAAARTYAAWRRDGVLRRDAAPTLYLYEQEFPWGGWSPPATARPAGDAPAARLRGRSRLSPRANLFPPQG